MFEVEHTFLLGDCVEPQSILISRRGPLGLLQQQAEG